MLRSLKASLGCLADICKVQSLTGPLQGLPWHLPPHKLLARDLHRRHRPFQTPPLSNLSTLTERPCSNRATHLALQVASGVPSPAILASTSLPKTCHHPPSSQPFSPPFPTHRRLRRRAPEAHALGGHLLTLLKSPLSGSVSTTTLLHHYHLPRIDLFDRFLDSCMRYPYSILSSSFGSDLTHPFLHSSLPILGIRFFCCCVFADGGIAMAFEFQNQRADCGVRCHRLCASWI